MTDETETQETPKPKRFYESAKPEQIPGGWTVELDGRSIKTPARVALKLPTEKLAKAVAAEWNAQDAEIDLMSMHLTRLANVAIDRVPETRYEMADELARYCETDLVCHIAEEPEELAELEEAHWAPLRRTGAGCDPRAGRRHHCLAPAGCFAGSGADLCARS